MRIIFKYYILFLMLPTLVHAQNLVPNPSFEEYKKLPIQFVTTTNISDFVYNWYSPNDATPDYYNANCNVPNAKVPNLLFVHGPISRKDSVSVYVQPVSGSAFTGIINEFAASYDRPKGFYYTEYLRTILNRTLTKNTKYNGFFLL